MVSDELARQFCNKGHLVVVLAQGEPRALDLHYPVRWFGKPVLPRVFPQRVGKALAALHRAQPFDLFLCNCAQPTGYAALRLGRRVGVPTVIVSHGGDWYRESADGNRPHLSKRTVYAYRHADGLIAISHFVEGLIRQINPQPARLELIPNGIDAAALTEPSTRPADFELSRPFALCLGNPGPIKGFGDAIAAYAGARDQLDDLAMVIVASGEPEASLRTQVAAAGLDADVLFAGRRTGNDKRWFLQNCRFGLIGPIEQGHPIVGLEFLAVGKPVVCSTNAAFDGLYDGGVNSLRVPAGDREALAGAIAAMSHGDLTAMGAESRRRGDHYTWPAIADRYLAFLGRVLSESGSSPRQ